MGRTGEEAEKLQQVMQRLMAKDGCPWDREQTHETLIRYLIEESYEVIDAIQHKDMKNLREELGDVLLQVIFHANLAEKEGYFTWAEVMEAERCKMIERHPHVFGDSPKLDKGEQVMQIWEGLKKKKSLLEGIPTSLPALLRGYKMQEKAARVGFDWEDAQGAWDKLYEEIAEFQQAEAPEHQKEEMGDVFFALVNVARFHGIEPEEAMQQTNQKFARRFAFVEEQVKQSGKNWEAFSLEELDAFWNQAKQQEKTAAPQE